MGPDTATATPIDPPAAGHGTGEDHALVVCFNTVKDELLGTLSYLLGSRDDALDVVQEAFIKCWKARDSVAGVHNLRAWVFTVAVNTARDVRRTPWARRVKPLAAEDAVLPARDPPPALAVEHAETLARLRAAIAELRPEEQAVFLLRQNGELTYEQIAELRAAPVGTVKTQMRSALIKLRKVLNPPD